MPTIFTHGFAAAALGKLFDSGRPPLRFWILAVLCAMLPDADVIGYSFGVARGSVWSHRGFTHSLLFALLVGVVVAFAAFRELPKKWSRAWLIVFFFLATASHGVLDALTDGGSGVAFFAPFSGRRFFFPFRPIEVSPIGVGRFLSARGVEVVLSELLWVWLPLGLLVAVVIVARKAMARRNYKGERR